MNSRKEKYTIIEAAEILQINTPLMYRIIFTGKLRSSRGFILHDDLFKYYDKYKEYLRKLIICR